MCLAVGPLRPGEWWKTALGVGAIWAWCLVLPWIRWSEDKCAVLDARAVMGKPLSRVKERFGRCFAVVCDASGNRVGEGDLADLDLSGLADGKLTLDFIGGLDLYVEGGIVRGGGFNYD